MLIKLSPISAPEVFAEDWYSEKCDVWSIGTHLPDIHIPHTHTTHTYSFTLLLGIIVYILLSGVPPFVEFEDDEEEEKPKEATQDDDKPNGENKDTNVPASSEEQSNNNNETDDNAKENQANGESRGSSGSCGEPDGKGDDASEASMPCLDGPPFWVYVNEMNQNPEELKLAFPEKYWKRCSEQVCV